MSRTMKDSGIPWIGEIPEGWSIDTIGNLYALRNEKVSDKDYPPLSVTKQGIVPQLETAAKTDDGDNRKLVKVGDFAINSRSDRRGSCGISAYDGSVSLINTVITPREQMNPCFYNWLFHSELFADEFYKWGHGIVDDLWTTRWQEMKRIGIITPPLAEQHLIATFLDKKCSEIDSLIELQEQMIEELKAYKQSVITEAVTKGLNPNVPMKDSGIEWIGDVPEEWEVKKLSKLLSFKGGFAFNSDDFINSGDNQVIRIGNVRNDLLRLEVSSVYISDDIAIQAQKSQLEKGQILFTMTGTKGKRDYFYTLLLKEEDFNGKKFFLNQRVGCFVPKNGVCANYYNYLLKDNHILDFIFLYETGTANQGNLGIESINKTILQYPPLAEQQAIADYLDKKCGEIDELITIKQQKIESLKEYKKSVIYEYVTGKREA
ncbi:MAG: restriction endonuclease subunit S [Paludibacteraceae bacterium]|nr:restriction endonuclease subunit S [Paludibacteraceae bacterium]